MAKKKIIHDPVKCSPHKWNHTAIWDRCDRCGLSIFRGKVLPIQLTLPGIGGLPDRV